MRVATLLGILEHRRFRRIGAVQERTVDVRVIATTQFDLEREVNRGRFRSALFFRLSTLGVRMPSLRERAEDMPLLVSRILEDLGARVPLSPLPLERLLETNQGNASAAIRASGLSRVHFYELLRRHGQEGRPARPARRRQAPGPLPPGGPFTVKRPAVRIEDSGTGAPIRSSEQARCAHPAKGRFYRE